MKTFIASLCLVLTGCVTMPNYRFVSSGQNVEDALIFTQALQGNSLKPLAPVHLRGSRNAAGDLLIEWTRRERLPLPLRDSAGTPLSEEQEVYVLEIYSGSTLKRSIRDPRVYAVKAISWNKFYDPDNTWTFSADGSLVYDASADRGVATSTEVLSGDFMIEFTRATNSVSSSMRMGVVPATISNADQVDSFGTAGYPFFEIDTSIRMVPMGNTSYQVSTTLGDKFTIERVGSIVRFYKNRHLSSAPVPIYETTFTSASSLRVFFRSGFGVATYTMGPTSLVSIGKRSYNYTANQQVDDFGSTQASIKTRVYQESMIVGKGYYIEASL